MSYFENWRNSAEWYYENDEMTEAAWCDAWKNQQKIIDDALYILNFIEEHMDLQDEIRINIRNAINVLERK